jgi:hypothetical protein
MQLPESILAALGDGGNSLAGGSRRLADSTTQGDWWSIGPSGDGSRAVYISSGPPCYVFVSFGFD